MSNETYLNNYIEILTGTMQDAILRNVSLQANAKVTEGVVNEQNSVINKLSEELEFIKNSNLTTESEKITELEQIVSQQQKQLNELNSLRAEYENGKHQIQHVDTFRNELMKEREQHQKTRNEYEDKIKELNSKIEYLQLTPAKRKKIDEANKPKEVFVTGLQVVEGPISQLLEEPTKDGGSF